MPEALGAVAATPDFHLVVLAIVAAGLVLGFAGFGAALIFLPVATTVLPVEEAIVAMSVTALGTTVSLVPRAWRQADRGEVGLLLLGAAVLSPLGVALLKVVPQEALRWTVAGVAVITLAALIAGWRWRGTVRRPGLVGLGGGAGLIGGMTGLTGPVVILFYLSGPSGAEKVRANTLLFLNLLAIVLIGVLWVQGLLTARALAAGALLVVPYMVAGRIGQAMFRPGAETTYRRIAYAVIGLSILTGLPLFD